MIFFVDVKAHFSGLISALMGLLVGILWVLMYEIVFQIVNYWQQNRFLFVAQLSVVQRRLPIVPVGVGVKAFSMALARKRSVMSRLFSKNSFF